MGKIAIFAVTAFDKSCSACPMGTVMVASCYRSRSATRLVSHIVKVGEQVPENDGSEPAKEKKPKLVLIFTTTILLQLLGLSKKASIDGTFKVACKGWKQLFILMCVYDEIQ